MKYGELNLDQIEVIVSKLGGMDGVHRLLASELVELVLKEAKQQILDRITSIQVSGAKRFVAEDCFKTAKVGWTGDNFNRLFKEKVEEDVAGITIAVRRLKKASSDESILIELGDCAEVRLAHLFELIQRQSRGEVDVLLANGRANIVYIKDNNGNFWVVSVNWSSRGYWNVEAGSIKYPSRWDDGIQILSRDS